MAHDYPPEQYTSGRYTAVPYPGERCAPEGNPRRAQSALDHRPPAQRKSAHHSAQHHSAQHDAVEHDAVEHDAGETTSYDRANRWDAAAEVAAVEFAAVDLSGVDLSPGLLDETEAGIEWGGEGALARELLAAALTDVAPCPVRERVLSTVDAVLIEPPAVPAFPADAAPVTTLSGVFEKRRPTTAAASCIDRAAESDRAIERAALGDAAGPDVARHDSTSFASGAASTAALDRAALAPAALAPAALEAAELTPIRREPSVDERSTDAMPGDPTTQGVVASRSAALTARGGSGGSAGCHATLGSPVIGSPVAGSPVAGSPHCLREGPVASNHAATLLPAVQSVFATFASGPHCWGGPMVGGRCNRAAVAIDRIAINSIATSCSVSGLSVSGLSVSSPRVASPTVSASFASGARAGTAFAGASFTAGGAVAPVASVFGLGAVGGPHSGAGLGVESPAFVSSGVAIASNHDAAFVAPERSTFRLREGLATSAFNLVQLAAAIVVGIVIGKAAHLIMAEESAMASSAVASSFMATGGGLRAEPSRSPDSDRSAGAADAVDPRDRAEVLGSIEPRDARAASRPRVSNPARAFSHGSAARSGPSTPERRPPCNLAAAQAVPALPSAPGSPGGVARRAVSNGVLSSGVRSKSAAPFACPTSVATTLAPQLPGATPSLLAPFPSSPLPSSPLPASPLQGSQTNDDPSLATDDWLGEQLAILARAERSIIEGDPESAARSLDEYKARFPDGLLDPQMASVRQRVEERFTAFIFP